MGWEDLQQKLEDTFTLDGVIGKKVSLVMEYEKNYGNFVEEKYRGHSILVHSFQEFFIETLEIAGSAWNEHDRKPTPPTYSETWLWHLANFRSLRAIDILFHNGYPMDGFARLRHLKESALYLAALLSGLTTYNAVNGIEGVEKITTREDMEQVRKRRMKEERRLLGLMIRKDSGFSEDQLRELGQWEEFFHQEVHGAMLTQVLEHGPAAQGKDTVSVAPKPRERSCAMFINRFDEVAWMLHRTLPILQLSYRPFGDNWQKKWRLLDENFYAIEQSLADMGKKIGTVFIDLINKKFAFTPEHNFDSHVKYPEVNKKGETEGDVVNNIK